MRNMQTNLFYILSVSKKEFMEIKNSLIKVSGILLLSLLPVGGVGFNQGQNGTFSPERNMLCTLVFAGLFSAIFLKEAITREKRQQTLEILLISKADLSCLIIGKILPVLAVSILFEVIQFSFLYGILIYIGSGMTSLFTIQSLLMMPFIYYSMCIVVLISSIIVNDEKASDVIGVILSFAVGILLLLGVNFLNAFVSWSIFLISCFGISVLNISLTFLCKWILQKSLLFIKL